MPAPTVSPVYRSTMISAPVPRLSPYESNGTARSSERLHTPMSFSSRVSAARCSPELTSTRQRGLDKVAPTVEVPMRARYGRPGSIGDSCIHTTSIWNWSATSAGSPALVMTSPRLQSTSVARHTVTESPASALTRSTSAPSAPITTMRSTDVVTPEGRMRILSPASIEPETIRPA